MDKALLILLIVFIIIPIVSAQFSINTIVIDSVEYTESELRDQINGVIHSAYLYKIIDHKECRKLIDVFTKKYRQGILIEYFELGNNYMHRYNEIYGMVLIEEQQHDMLSSNKTD